MATLGPPRAVLGTRMAYIQTISTSSLQRRRYTRRSFLSVQVSSLREADWNAEGRIIDRLLFAREAIRPALFFSSRDARAHTLLTHPRQTSRKQCSFPSCQPLSCRAQSAERRAQSAERRAQSAQIRNCVRAIPLGPLEADTRGLKPCKGVIAPNGRHSDQVRRISPS
jgi:hypothetical protein